MKIDNNMAMPAVLSIGFVANSRNDGENDGKGNMCSGAQKAYILSRLKSTYVLHAVMPRRQPGATKKRIDNRMGMLSQTASVYYIKHGGLAFACVYITNILVCACPIGHASGRLTSILERLGHVGGTISCSRRPKRNKKPSKRRKQVTHSGQDSAVTIEYVCVSVVVWFSLQLQATQRP